LNSGGASAPQSTITSNVWVHALPSMKATKPVDQERLLLLCFPTPSVRVTATYKKNKTKQQALSPFLLDFFRSTSHRSVLFVSPCSLFQAAGRVTIGLLAFGFPSGLQAVLQCICCSRRLAGES
jgi:hypothetical protein